MRACATLVALLLLGGCSAPGPRPSPAPSPSGTPAPSADAPLPSPLPGIVARLDGDPIYLYQIVPLARAKLDRSADQDRDKPILMRQALREYIDRELLLKEALARGVQADNRMVQQLYDSARAEFPDEEKWKADLYTKGFDPQSFRTELRVQQTVGRFLARESGTEQSAATEEAMTQRAATARTLLLRLRARSRIETYL